LEPIKGRLLSGETGNVSMQVFEESV